MLTQESTTAPRTNGLDADGKINPATLGDAIFTDAQVYQLTADEIAVLDAIDEQARALETDASAHLRNIIRTRKLQGNQAFDRATNSFRKV